MKLLGFDVGGSQGGDDVSGDINVRGDTTVNNPPPPAMSGLTKAAMTADLLGSGLGGGMLLEKFMSDDTPPAAVAPSDVAPVDENTQYELKLEGSEPIL